MSRPRRVIKGHVWFVTRRCICRIFLLRPDKDLNALIGYCLARAIAKTGVQIHAFFFASNHLHLVLSDPNGHLPEFMRRLDSLIARATNCLRGRWDHFWEGDSYSAVELLTDEAIWDKLIYTLTNPVKDGLVPTHYQWPGLIANPSHIGRWLEFRRPTKFFRKHNLPETLGFKLTMPPLASGGDERSFCAELTAAVVAREAKFREEAKQQGKRFVGRRAILRQSFSDSPTTNAPRRKLNPRLAAQSPTVMARAKQELTAFYAAYAKALKRFSRGKGGDVVFPEGTYLMHVRYAVSCAGPSG